MKERGLHLKLEKPRSESQLPFQILDLKSPPCTSVFFCDMGTIAPTYFLTICENPVG